MAKWKRSGKKVNAQSVTNVFNDEQTLTDADIQRIWEESKARPGDTVTIYPSGQTIQRPAPGTPILASQVTGGFAPQTPANPGYVPTYTQAASVPISTTPMPDPLQAVIDQRVEACFRALIHDQDITIAALQEQIDELWAELRNE